MYILGISCYFHDAAAALLHDGQLVAAAEEERFTRLKHDTRFPIHAIEFCLAQAGIKGDDLDYVVFYEKPFLKFERLLLNTLQTFPRSWQVFREAMITWLLDKLWVKGLIRDKLSLRDSGRILFCEHHLSHAASAFYCSPFERAAILTADGVGEWTTATYGLGRGTQINLYKEMRYPHSLGLLYSAFTAFLGFEVNEGEYKVMGMAPYGQPRYADKVYKLLTLRDDGSFWLNMDYFCYHYSSEKTFNRRFEALFGPPRRGQGDGEVDPYYADVAASIQLVLEEVLLKMAHQVYRETGEKKLCLAGGVALNSVANWRILQNTPFEELYVQPAAGDSGGALGAALWAYHSVLGQPRRFVLGRADWGSEYSDGSIGQYLEGNNIAYEHIGDEERLLERVVDYLLAGKVVGWFRGRFEWGPRALGHRSILADPRRAEMKDIVNQKIKFREPFRPFAPSVLAESAPDFFCLAEAQNHYPTRFMLYVVPVKEEKQPQVPAITHVDGTGRLQIVHREINPSYYKLIERFGQATGVPVVLNTSFNLRGEPIVNSPADAVSTFFRSGMDALVLQSFLCTKKG